MKIIKYRETTFPELQTGHSQEPVLESGLPFQQQYAAKDVKVNSIHLEACKNPQSLICSLAEQPAHSHCTLLSLFFSFSLGYLAHNF